MANEEATQIIVYLFAWLGRNPPQNWTDKLTSTSLGSKSKLTFNLVVGFTTRGRQESDLIDVVR